MKHTRSSSVVNDSTKLTASPETTLSPEQVKRNRIREENKRVKREEEQAQAAKVKVRADAEEAKRAKEQERKVEDAVISPQASEMQGVLPCSF